MAVSYLAGGEEITAARMNLLFAEVERKLGLLLDGKSPLLITGAGASTATLLAPLLGLKFFFINGERNFTFEYGGTNYVHQAFVDAAAATAEVAGTRDTEKKILTIEHPAQTYYDQAGVSAAELLLEHSLQAHTRTVEGVRYWLRESPQAGFNRSDRAERRSKYAVAELIFEGPGYEVFNFPAAWDKFNFFRIHNLNAYAMAVQFAGGPSVSVPAWGCKCVRRTPATGAAAASGYDSSWKYFWKFAANDPRFFQFKGLSTLGAVTNSMAANNVINPAGTLYGWINSFLSGGSTDGIRFHRDPSVRYSIADLYAEVFGDPDVGGTILGDLLHQQGALKYLHRNVDQTVYTIKETEFRGYATIKEDLGRIGLAVTESGDDLKVTGAAGNLVNDLGGPGTNLLKQNGSGSGVVEVGGTGYTLDRHLPGVFLTPGIPSTVATAYSYRLPGGGTREVTVSYERTEFVSVTAGTTGPGLVIWKDKVEKVLELNWLGAASLKDTDQDTNVCTFESRAMDLTCHGLQLYFTQKLSLAGQVSGGGLPGTLGPGVSSFLNHAGSGATSGIEYYASFDGVSLNVKGAVAFDGYGWPAKVSLPDAGFVGGRLGRKYSLRPLVSRSAQETTRRHPQVSNDPTGTDGDDLDWTWAGCDYQELEAAGIAAMALERSGTNDAQWVLSVPVWAQPDTLYEFEQGYRSTWETVRGPVIRNEVSKFLRQAMPRVMLSREIYNTMAAWVNSLVSCKPFTWENFRYRSTSAGVQARLGPNTTGLYGTTIRPVECYSSFALGSTEHLLWQALGVQIRTVDNLPESYATMVADLGKSFRWKQYFEQVVETVELLGKEYLPAYDITVSHYRYTVRKRWADLLEVTEGTSTENQVPGAFGVFGGSVPALLQPNDFLWVAIEDVKAAAEAQGFKFLFQEIAVGLDLESFHGYGPVFMFDSKGESEDVRTILEDVEPTGLLGHPKVPRNTGEVVPFPAGAQDWWEASEQASYWRFVQKSDAPAWKASAPAPLALADYRPGDIIARGLILSAADPGMVRWWSIVFDEDARAELRGRTMQNQVRYYRNGLFQGYASTGFTRGSKAIRIPAAWLDHATTDFSGGGPAQAAVGGAAEYLPLAARAAGGVQTVTDLPEGNTVFGPEKGEGKAEEVLFWLGDVVDLG